MGEDNIDENNLQIYGFKFPTYNDEDEIVIADFFKPKEITFSKDIKEKPISRKKCVKYLMSIGYSRNEAYGTVKTFVYRRMMKVGNSWYLIYRNIWGRGGLI